jgi:hypothetical protein
LATLPLPSGGVVSRPIGLDFGAVLAMGAALDVDQKLLASVLPRVEAAIIASYSDEPEMSEEGE